MDTTKEDCNTDIVRLSYTWIVKMFSQHAKASLHSGIFRGDKVRWRLSWVLNDQDTAYSIFLLMYSENKSHIVPAKFRCTILNKSYQEGPTNLTYHEFCPNEGWGFREFVSKEVLLNQSVGLLPDDTLTIYCEIDALESHRPVQVPVSKFRDDMSELFDSPQFSDVTIDVNGTEFKAHKVILATRCPVFLRMFRNDMLENKVNRVDITDLEPLIIREMLIFIYSDSWSFEAMTTPNKGDLSGRDTQPLALDLLRAADKYQLDKLKAICEHQLSKTMCEDNATELLIMADRYNAGQLKRRALEFIVTNATKVIRSNSWARMASENPELGLNVMSQVFRDVAPEASNPTTSRRRYTFVS